jgi:hypothetical protein
MWALGEVGGKGLPRAIPAAELQKMLQSNPSFCSWDASNSTTTDSVTGWPYLFSHPLATPMKKPTQ